MKLRTIQQGDARRRSRTAPLLISLALVSGTLALGTGPAMGEGGGTPIGDQGVPRNYQSQGEARFGSNYNGGGRQQVDRGRSADRQQYRGNYSDRNSRSQRYYSGSNHYYSGSQYYGRPSSSYYSYGSPAYIYGPSYDPYPSSGVSLFFNF